MKLRDWLYAFVFLAGWLAAQYSVTGEDTEMEINQAFLDGVEYGAKEATLNQASCTWRSLFVEKK